ncbi:MAG: hypothetical protein HKN04_09630 [Rhodothermaceae bacterium]|nr:hypothetical protein [Rhodothermaceae bacterium]
MRCTLLVLVFLLAAGCSGTAEDAPSSENAPIVEGPPPGNPPMGGPVEVAPGLPLDELLDSRVDGATLQARLNAPRRMETEPVANRHVAGQVDTLRTYVYDGIRLQFYTITGGGALLQEVTVTGEGYTTAEGLGVGSTRDEIEATYPHSLGAEGSTITYERDDEEPTPTVLRVTYDGDRASSLTWLLYVD